MQNTDCKPITTYPIYDETLTLDENNIKQNQQTSEVSQPRCEDEFGEEESLQILPDANRSSGFESDVTHVTQTPVCESRENEEGRSPELLGEHNENCRRDSLMTKLGSEVLKTQQIPELTQPQCGDDFIIKEKIRLDSKLYITLNDISFDVVSDRILQPVTAYPQYRFPTESSHIGIAYPKQGSRSIANRRKVEPCCCNIC